MPPSRLPWIRMLSHAMAAASQSEIRCSDRGAVEVLGRRGQRQAALLEAIEPRRSVERAVNVLLDQHDGRSLGGDGAEALIDVADDDWGEAERQLVAEKKPRIGHEGAADRRHLLLPARQRRRRQVAQVAQAREQLIDASQGPRAFALAVAAEQQVLLD